MISSAAAYISLATEATQAQWKDLAEYHAANPSKEKFVYMRRKFLATITEGLNAAQELIEAQQAEIERLKAEAPRVPSTPEPLHRQAARAAAHLHYHLTGNMYQVDLQREAIRTASLQAEKLRLDTAYALYGVDEGAKKARQAMPTEPVH